MKHFASLHFATAMLAAFTFFVTALPAQEIPVRAGVVVVKLSAAQAAAGEAASLQVLRDALAPLDVERIEPFVHAATGGYQAAPSHTRGMAPATLAELQRLEAEVSRIVAVTYGGDESPWTVAARLSGRPEVDYAEPWFLMVPLSVETAAEPDDSLYAQQAFLKTIKAAEAFAINEGSAAIVIGVGDTDVKWDHPDLEGNIWINPGEDGQDGQGRSRRTNGVDDDGNGLIDDWHGWDFAGADNNTPDNDTRSSSGGHGTAVAGLVSAVTNNRIGIASIGNRCRILPFKVGPDAGGNLTYAYQALDMASRMGAKVFNASWGSFGYSKSGEDVINLATSRGMVVVGGAGNHGGTEPFYPASYAAVLNAGVCDANDVIQGASGYGPPVDVMTPGQGALTTNVGGGYSAFGATSAAAPIASGLAGLVAAHFPSYTPAQIRERIRVTCDNIDAKNPTKAKFAGKGRINALRALSDPATPSLRVQSVVLVDPNADGRLDVGEEIGVVVTLRNWLEATGAPVTLVLTPVTFASSVDVTHGSVTIAAIAANGTGGNASEPMRFTVKTGAVPDATVMFRVDISSGAYEDFDFVSASVNPSYQPMTSGQLSISVQANGMLGFKDYPTNTLGTPMALGAADLQLYLGSLMLATDQAHVVSNARSAANFLVRDNDYRIVDPTVIQAPFGAARAGATSRFTDANADSARRVRVSVLHEVIDYSNRGIMDLLFSKFTITNTGAAPLIGLRAGMFMDFGGYPQYYIGSVGYDSLHRFGYVTKTGFPTVGTFVIDSLPAADARRSTFWAINNDPAVPGNPFGTLDGFTAAEKWRALSTYAGNRTTPAGNVAYVITAPVTDIEPGQSASFVFGHTAGAVLSVLQSRVDAAISLWRNPPVVSVPDLASVPGTAALAAYPQPVRADAGVHLSYTMPAAGFVHIDAISVLGVRTRLFEGLRSAGGHTLELSARMLPPGMYVVTLSSAGAVATTRLLLTR